MAAKSKMAARSKMAAKSKSQSQSQSQRQSQSQNWGLTQAQPQLVLTFVLSVCTVYDIRYFKFTFWLIPPPPLFLADASRLDQQTWVG